MSTYLLEQIKNFRRCRVTYQRHLEVEAVVDVVAAEFPDRLYYKLVSQNGLGFEDIDVINEIITDNSLHCTLDECTTALQAHCDDVAAELEAQEWEEDNNGQG